jgi:colicin import membrane protein
MDRAGRHHPEAFAPKGKSLMPRKLKTYLASLGFFDLAIAAPSMKAALEAWGSKTNHFHQGFAKESNDPEIIAATMAKPGVVLRRAVGSIDAFSEHPGLPKNLPSGKVKPPELAPKPQPSSNKIDEKTARKAAIAYAKDQKRRDRERRREEAAQESERKRREQATAKADAEFDAARQAHDIKTEEIAAARAALDQQSEAEQIRWDEQRAKLEAVQRRARE